MVVSAHCVCNEVEYLNEDNAARPAFVVGTGEDSDIFFLVKFTWNQLSTIIWNQFIWNQLSHSACTYTALMTRH